MMNFDLTNIKNQVENFYDIKIEYIKHLRSMIGHVYTLQNEKQKYILKINRPKNKKSSIHSTEIIDYLYKNNYPVVEIIKTKNNENYFEIETKEGVCIGYIYDYVEGTEPNIEKDITKIGQQIGLFHNILEKYPKNILTRGKEFYIDRFITLLEDFNYDKNKTTELNDYGIVLWNEMEKSKRGLCHGDLHSGNMLLYKGKYVLFDFDTSSYTFPLIDVATLCDTTNFNKLIESDFDKIMNRFEKFYNGYIKERNLEDTDIKNIFNFIPIRHYELIATITINEKSPLNKSFSDQQYEWIMKWKNLVERKMR